MVRTSIFVSVLVFCAAGLLAQDVAQYQPLMRAGAGANGPLRAAVTAKDATAITASANKMADAFDQIVKFWQQNQKEDAVKFAETIRDAAKSIAGSSSADDQANALKTIGGACGGCHAAHREGAAPPFKIK